MKEIRWHARAGQGAKTASQLFATAMLKSGKYENLYVDVAFTVFADDEFVHLLKVLLVDERVRSRVLFGSDFYVVEDAKIEERRLGVRMRSVLGEELFRTISRVNPRSYLGDA